RPIQRWSARRVTTASPSPPASPRRRLASCGRANGRAGARSCARSTSRRNELPSGGPRVRYHLDAPSQTLREAHQLERPEAEHAVWVGERLENLEVIVALRDDQLDRLASGRDSGVELAGLALKLRRLVRSIGEHQRRV